MNTPAISVVIPAYNAERTVAETLDSVLAQSMQDFEIIVVNDGSRDATGAILDFYAERHPGKVRVIHQENTGQARARNNGIAAARGRYIAFNDADDIWAPEKLERQLRFLEDNPEYGLCYTEGMTIDEKGRKKEPFGATREFTGRCFETLITRNNIIGSSVMVRRAVLDDVGVFNPELRACENWELWTRIARKYPIACIDEKLSFYRQHGGNMSKDIDRMRENRIAAIQHNRRQYDGVVPNIESLTRNALYLAYRGFGGVYLGQLELAKARRDIGRAILLKPWVLRNYLWYLQCLMGPDLLRALRSLKRRALAARAGA
ncbi:MAG TPA: glycosyltransferase family A protein [Sphingomonadales bacterium]